jgi:hypothetical protein
MIAARSSDNRFIKGISCLRLHGLAMIVPRFENPACQMGIELFRAIYAKAVVVVDLPTDDYVCVFRRRFPFGVRGSEDRTLLSKCWVKIARTLLHN